MRHGLGDVGHALWSSYMRKIGNKKWGNTWKMWWRKGWHDNESSRCSHSHDNSARGHAWELIEIATATGPSFSTITVSNWPWRCWTDPHKTNKECFTCWIFPNTAFLSIRQSPYFIAQWPWNFLCHSLCCWPTPVKNPCFKSEYSLLVPGHRGWGTTYRNPSLILVYKLPPY